VLAAVALHIRFARFFAFCKKYWRPGGHECIIPVMKVLCAWLGNADLQNAELPDADSAGAPISRIVVERGYRKVLLLSSHESAKNNAYGAWLKKVSGVKPEICETPLEDPTDFMSIYESAMNALSAYKSKHPDTEWVFTPTPGTPQMGAVLIIFSQTCFRGDLVGCSRQRGVADVKFPFNITAEYIPWASKQQGIAVTQIASGGVPENISFDYIKSRCPQMIKARERAKRLADFKVPVLLMGETGTGKELFARAIHNASSRRNKPFKAVNCGAIPSELLESTLFGHTKGAFSGAIKDYKGLFREADGGTVFLDEIGDMPLNAQVKLLRVIQDNKVTPVGSSEQTAVDVRVIAATHKNIPDMVARMEWREDLFYRLAVEVLILPPLRERSDDIAFLIDEVLHEINNELSKDTMNYVKKQLSPDAKRLLTNQRWPGNIRELKNVLCRSAIRTAGGLIGEDIIRDALNVFPATGGSKPGRTALGDGFSLNKEMENFEAEYLRLALDEAGGQKAKAAKLLGLGRQTFASKMKRLLNE